MTEFEAIYARHSVRCYTPIPIGEDVREELDECLEEINAESGLNISIRYDDPEGFDSRLAHYGSFRNVENYIVLAGPDCEDFEEKCGYYGEKLVLKAQQLGLNTCWAAMTFNRRMVKRLVAEGQRFCMVIALGYGETQGTPHKNKLASDVTPSANVPGWFKEGVKAALLAPTAVNQQNFWITLEDEEPVIRTVGFGPCLKVDLGIVKYHFEVASGRKVK